MTHPRFQCSVDSMTIQMNTLQRYISINESVYFGEQNVFLFLAEFGNKIIRFDHSNKIYDSFSRFKQQ